jgi:ABC-type glycerol-3-phosphate transport system substrate-binding protein
MKSSPFQYLVLIVFGFLGLFGVLVFSGIIPLGGTTSNYMGEVRVWGFIPEREIGSILEDFKRNYEGSFGVSYEYHDRNSFDSEFVNALAKGDGPDILMFPNDLIIKHGDKILQLPYSAYSERLFKETFAEAGEIFLMQDGVLALPMYVDPLVMYWNRDLFTNAGLASHPKTWLDFLNLSSLLTKKDSRGNVSQSMVAMGTYGNISNAGDILSTLMMQAGDRIISRSSALSGGGVDSFQSTFGTPNGASESAINYYLEFSNQAKGAYSWNTALPVSRKMFESGKLAVYFGRASEHRNLKASNPHLNFDVATMPQRDDSNRKLVFGEVVGLAVTKASKLPNTAVSAVYALSGRDFAGRLAEVLYLPTLRRDILSETNDDHTMSIFNSSAIISKTWYNPGKSISDNIFDNMIKTISSGKDSPGGAIDNARRSFMEHVR